MVKSKDGVPLVDLAPQHAEIAEELAAGWKEVVESTAFIGGPHLGWFEREYAEYCGTTHCVGVGSGTDAIELALRASGVGPGDECVLPVNTFIATAEAIVRTGAQPVFVDCDADTLLLDAGAAKAAFTERTKAVIPVHLYGQIAPIDPIVDECRTRGITIVEDAAQAQGAVRLGVRAGAVGDVAATSFYPGKNLGCYGDGGAVTTGSASMAETVRLLGGHGSPRKYEHSIVGFNSRLDTMQAVVLRAKLRRLESWNAARREAAAYYDELLSAVPAVVTPVVAEGNEHVWHLYVIRVGERDRVLGSIHADGIGAAVHYPTPVHLTGAFAGGHGARGAYPNAERAADEILSLPMYPGITRAQQDRVVESLACAVAG